MGAMRAVAILLGATAVGLSVYATISPMWGTNVENVAGMPSFQKKAIGLWKACTAPNGQSTFQCVPLKQFGIQHLARTGVIGFRALMIIGLIAGTVGLVSGITSSNAVNLAKSTGDKNKAAGGAAGGFMAAGLCVLAATSWAAHKIIRRYSGMNMGGGFGNTQGLQWTLGSCIYCGWVAAAIFIGSAIIMFMGCCQSNDDEDDYYEDHQAHPHAYAESGYSQGKKEFV